MASTPSTSNTTLTITLSPLASLVMPLAISLFLLLVLGVLFNSVIPPLLISIAILGHTLLKIATTKLEVDSSKKEAVYSSYLTRKVLKDVNSIECSGIPFIYTTVIVTSKGFGSIILSGASDPSKIKAFIENWS